MSADNNTEDQVSRKLASSVKAKWVDALRSGKYRQAGGVLKDTNGRHCCLGVLADITDPSKWDDAPVESNEAEKECYPYAGAETLLQDKFLASIGMSTNQAVALASMNDEGEPFSEIADWIETNL